MRTYFVVTEIQNGPGAEAAQPAPLHVICHASRCPWTVVKVCVVSPHVDAPVVIVQVRAVETVLSLKVITSVTFAAKLPEAAFTLRFEMI
jgi:hypothetical protein